MSDWIVIPAGKQLINEFNAVNPNRDKGADGTKGDSSHTSSSDHTPDEDSDQLKNKDSDTINEVHAVDIDSTGPWPSGVTFDAMMKTVIEGEKKKWNDPNTKCRLNYTIWDHYIYDKDNDFNPVWYTATSDPHTGHAHFSFRYETSCENDTRPYGVEERYADVLNESDKPTLFKWLDEYFDKYTQDANEWRSNPVGRAIWNNQSVPNPLQGVNQKTPAYDLVRDMATVMAEEQTTQLKANNVE
jgi:hypothetical protein